MQPRASRRAAREAHKVLEKLSEYMASEDMSESEPERAPRVHWRKQAAAARMGGRGLARKPGHKARSKPHAAPKRKREASSPPPAVHPVPPPLQLRLPSPVEEPPIVQPRVVSAQSATKLRTHHHEFLSEYSKVRFCCGPLLLLSSRHLFKESHIYIPTREICLDLTSIALMSLCGYAAPAVGCCGCGDQSAAERSTAAVVSTGDALQPVHGSSARG